MRIFAYIIGAVTWFLTTTATSATPGPSPSDVNGALLLGDPQAQAIFSYRVQRGLRERVGAPPVWRMSRALPPGLRAAAPVTSNLVFGDVEILVIPVLFAAEDANDAAPPYKSAALRRHLFGGFWRTGALTQYFLTMSQGRFQVTGQVTDWVRLSKDQEHYTGGLGCEGVCRRSGVKDLLREALEQVDPEIDFTRYDNNSLENIADSPQDDGYVDVVFFVHASPGGECPNVKDAILSHHFSYNAWHGQEFVTDDITSRDTLMRIDEYAIVPALSCEGGMIEIGAFAHEFSHFLTLPDLYDAHGGEQTAGIGVWGVMGRGFWGNPALNQPETPTHMSAWSKEYVGWVQPRIIAEDAQGVELRPVANSGDVVLVDYTNAVDPEDEKYLLLEHRRATGFDAGLPGDGLLVSEIDNAAIRAGLANNRVNARASALGVNIIEADGRRDLHRPPASTGANHGDDGDLFPGSEQVLAADETLEGIGAALCAIDVTEERVRLDIYVSRTTCPEAETAAVGPSAGDPLEEAAEPASVADEAEAEANGGVEPEAFLGAEAAEAAEAVSPFLELYDFQIDDSGAARRSIESAALGEAGTPGDEIILQGVLRNLGANYFGDRRLVLQDPEGFEIPVTAPLVLETLVGAGPSETPTLSDVLDREIIARGVLRHDQMRGFGEIDFLHIESFEIVE